MKRFHGMAAVLGCFLLGGAHATVRADAVTFTQLSFQYDGVPKWADTEWGCAHFDYAGPGQLMYFNLAVNGTWQVQNAPIVAVNGVGVSQSVAFDFDLGTPRGTAVSSLQYSYQLTTGVLDVMPGGGTSAAVSPEAVREWGGLDDQVMPDDLPAAHPHVGGEAADPTPHVNPDFPNQQCHKNECVPAAVSNSLQFLNREKELGLTADQTSIARMKSATGWDTDGCWTNSGWHRTGTRRMTPWERMPAPTRTIPPRAPSTVAATGSATLPMPSWNVLNRP